MWPLECIVTKSKNVYWNKKLYYGDDKINFSSNNSLILLSAYDIILRKFRSQDQELNDENNFVRVNFTPKDFHYFTQDKWELSFMNKDNSRILSRPIHSWFSQEHFDKVRQAREAWKIWLNSIVDLSKMPKNPFLIKANTKNVVELTCHWQESLLERVCYRYYIHWLVSIECFRQLNEYVGEDFEKYFFDIKIRTPIFQELVANFQKDNHIEEKSYEIEKGLNVGFQDQLFEQCAANMGAMLLQSTRLYTNGKYEYQEIVDLWKQGIMPMYYNDKWHYLGSPEGNGKCQELKIK